MSRLTCESCGVIYSRAAIVRQMGLATGVACRRCGGKLTAEVADTPRRERGPVQALSAAVHGLERGPSGWRAVDDRGPRRGHPRPEAL